ncbi:hypothetical protein [Tahibacter caeni]|uniref:hypothetical protein n=1 Tax=Tahibacter caeni TaxID=1453545 RepID=UPI002148C3CB|nr:hypothetical protein [Tahibacter caeni]
MKLVGGRTEQEYREGLVRSNLSLRNSSSRLGAALEAAGVDVANAYVVFWIPEQAEDIYQVLTPAREIVTVELSRYSDDVLLLERQSLKDYERGRSQQDRIKLAVALDLIVSKRRGVR